MMRMGRPVKFEKGRKGASVKLIKTLKPYRGKILISVLCTIVSVVLAILAPQFLSKLTDEMAVIGRSIDVDYIWKIAKILITFYSTTAILSVISGLVMNHVNQSYARDLRRNIVDKINRMPLSYFDTHPYGDTLSRVTNDVDTISQSLQQSITMLMSSIFMLVGVIIAMFVTNWIMAFTVLITLPLMIMMILFITKMAVPQFRRRQEATGVVNGIVEENYTGAVVIELFNAQEYKGEAFTDANEDLHKAMIKAQIFGGMLQPIMTFISYVAYAAVCLVGGLLMAHNKGISFGTITAFLVYVNLFQNPLSQLAQATNTVQMAAAASGRVFDLLESPEEEDESGKPMYLLSDTFNNVKGEVEFKNVRFGYTENKVIIPDFSCHVNPGMKVAIVGPTGAGKTTLVNLLMRFYELDGGDILIDGVSIKDMSKKEIRNIFSMVLQDSWIFDGTLKDNVVYAKKNVSDETLANALKEASLEHYVKTLEHGADTHLSGDSSLSQGQKQLLTIARAFVENAPLLILDEATSNVDTRTEILIQEAMDRLTHGRTSFVIAHRLSTIKNADLILVLKDGNIVEQGNHDELMKQNGFYCDLYNSQFEESME